jgi:hypothetical protein
VGAEEEEGSDSAASVMARESQPFDCEQIYIGLAGVHTRAHDIFNGPIERDYESESEVSEVCLRDDRTWPPGGLMA